MAGAHRAVLVVELDDHWAGLVRALESDGLEVDILSPRTPTAEVVACATRSDGVVVVDLGFDPAAAMTTVAACRYAAPLVPVIVVAANPSLELARSVRLSGAFYLALEPLSLDELRTVLDSAFRCIERRRASASRCHATRRILVVDDDVDFLASTTALLEAHGYWVSQARSAREGLERLAAEPPDLVVLDVIMENDWAGYAVNEAIKFEPGFECVRHVPVLMVSAIGIDPAVRFGHSEESALVTPNAYMTKPLDVPLFIAEVAGLLGERVPVGAEGR